MDINFSKIFNISELYIEEMQISDTKIRVFAKSNQESCTCNKCGARLEKVHQTSYREIEDLPILEKSVQITLRVRNFYCFECSKQTAESFSFVRPRCHQTIRYEKRLYK
jgi:transposase